MTLLELAPGVQEALLKLQPCTRDPLTERELREVVTEVGWVEHEGRWQHLQPRLAT